MGKTTMRSNAKKCALCKHWNGSRGSDTIVPKIGGCFEVEMTEKQTCYLKTNQTTAIFSCLKFEPRY